MLREIHIKNFAIIGDLSVSFEPGLNVLTGETGAGKSILIDALNLSIGGRANVEHIKSGEETATVSAVFDKFDHLLQSLEENGISITGDDFLILKRIISKSDRNRAFINDTPVALGLISNISEKLIDIHGQHQHQSLFDKNFRLEIVDDFGNLHSLRKEMENLFTEFTKTSKGIKEFEKDLEARKKDQELAEFQYNELVGSSLVKDEENKLEEEIRILSNAERLCSVSRKIYDKLYGSEYTIYSEIHSIKKELQDISKVDDKLKNQASSIEEIEISISEIAQFLLKYSEDIDISPQRLEEANNRLSLLTKLHRKYGCKTNEDLLQFMENLNEKLISIETKDEKLIILKEHYKILKGKMVECASRLSKARRVVTAKLEKLVMEEFKELGIEKGRFKIDYITSFPTSEEKKDVESVDGIRYTASGTDEIDFLFSANPGEELKSMSKIASGGEISRIMLALKTNLANVDKLDSLIFDEVDAGIGGKVATSVGRRLKKLSRSHQVLAVTHLAQIAAFADNHIKVEKFEKNNKTSITVEKLTDKKKRVIEISRMLSGDLKSDTSLKHADELLEMGVQH